MFRQRLEKLVVIAIIVSVAVLIITMPANVRSASVDVRVSDYLDDGEERVSDGAVDLTSQDLELVDDSGNRGLQIVGIRFQNVAVPQGSVITNAYIELEAYETDSGATSLTIRGEAADNANYFSSAGYNISNRYKTAAFVSWGNMPAWNILNERHQTPDLKSIVQEIVDRTGWASGNSMAFIISGTGERTAASYDGKSGSAPLLHIEYTSNSIDIRVSQSSDDAEENAGNMSLASSDLELGQDGSAQTVGIRFRNVNVPQGALITRCYIEFETDEIDTVTTNLVIKGESSDTAVTFSSLSGDISSRATTNASVSWTNVPEWNTVDEIHRTPDLSSIVQEIIGRSGWSAGNAMVFIITGSGQRTAESYDGEPAAAPLLHIEYAQGGFPFITVDKNTLGSVCYVGTDASQGGFTLSNTGSATLGYTISDNATWLSCSAVTGQLTAGGYLYVTVSYITSSLSAGAYWGTITISDPNAPNSPVEIDVGVTVQALPASTACGHVPVYTENLVSPAILILLDVSGSMRTLMPISDQANNPRTPDLAPIVQEIVNRSGWASGNSMVFIITGSGRRTAKSYDGSSGSAPLLHVEYDLSSVVDVRVSRSSDDAEEKSTRRVTLNSNDLELVNDGSDQTVGIRFQNVQIPKGATITKAYIEFVINVSNNEATSLIIKGEASNNPPTFSTSTGNISNRVKTSASVSWSNVPEWIKPTDQSRVDIGKAVISELVKDTGISWGYGTWSTNVTSSDGYDSSVDYTKVHIGCKFHDANHQADLQAKVAATTTYSRTPFAPSIEASRKYFTCQKKDKDGTGDYYVEIDCQPKFLIEITDGLGNVDSTNDTVRQRTNDLCDAGVTPIAVGFGIDDATQIKIMAEVSNSRGHLSSDLYAVHDEVNGVGQPFLAFSKEALAEALATITERIKVLIFHGSSPAPTTTADHGDMVIVAEFNPADWSGDLVANTFDPSTGKWDYKIWRASEAMPSIRAIYTVDPFDANSVILYTDSVLANDNWLCKDIGDIIKSTPIIIGTPPFFYDFDGYKGWKRGVTRDPMVYVGANDGSLHAFSLLDGSERWAFVPKSSHVKLDKANDPIYNMCGEEYCHQYFVDGSPQAGDIYTGSSWMTILVCGLREGGESYFALDVTHSNPFGQTDGVNYLWEFMDPELGQTWADPCIERVRNGSGAAWSVFFGSGYSTSDQANKEAYLYGIVAHDKSPLWRDGINDVNRIKLSSSTLKNDALSPPLVADLNADYKGDRIYAGNMYGTLYRVSSIGKGETPVITELFDFGGTSQANPIRAKAAYAYGTTAGDIWVYFGTGRYESQIDKTTMTKQYFFGLRESISSTRTYRPGDYDIAIMTIDAALTQYTNPVTGETRPVRVIYGSNTSKNSWAVELDNSSSGLLGSERVIEEPLVAGGIVYFTTFIPDEDICAGNGDAWVYALSYDTGLPPICPVFDLNGDGVFNDDDKVEDAQGVKHSVAAIKVGSGQGSNPVLLKNTLFITTTDEDVTALHVNMPGMRANVTSWKDKTL
ncbi:hypothetical protein JXL19_01060 [bacterium]|nr:hypothetical protein [bacterium]